MLAPITNSAAQLAGEFIAKKLKAGDEVAIIRGAAGDPVHNLRADGAKEAMEKAGLKVVDVQPADSDRAKGQSVAENLLTKYPDLKGIDATNDEMALGAFNAAKAAGKTLVIVGFDASPNALDSIAAGELAGSVAQFPGKIGEIRHADCRCGCPRTEGGRLRQHRCGCRQLRQYRPI